MAEHAHTTPPDPAQSVRRFTPGAKLEAARRGAYQAGVIASILKGLGDGEISGSTQLCGTQLVYLADCLTAAVDAVEGALA